MNKKKEKKRKEKKTKNFEIQTKKKTVGLIISYCLAGIVKETRNRKMNLTEEKSKTCQGCGKRSLRPP